MVKVRDVMSKPAVTVAPDALVKDAAAVLAERNISGMPVVSEGRVVGIFSEADVLKSIKTSKKNLKLIYPSISSLGIAFQEEEVQREIIDAYEEIGKTPVSEVMTRNVITVPPDIELNEAIMKMVRNGINRLPVVEKGVLIGIVTRGDVIRGLALEQNNKRG